MFTFETDFEYFILHDLLQKKGIQARTITVKTLKQLKSNKSGSSDGLAAELFNMGSERFTVEMHQLIVKIWDQKELPKELKLAVIHQVYKKGDRLDCSQSLIPPTRSCPRSCPVDLRLLLQISSAATKLSLLEATPPPTKFSRYGRFSSIAESARSQRTTCSSTLRRPTTS